MQVYQHNVYAEGSKFHSFKKVMTEMGSPYDKLEVASFMTCSKGFMGECGIRGGYAEVVNMDPDVMAMLQKSISAKLCPTVVGQACMDVVVNPPKPGDPSYNSWEGEVANTLASYADRAKLVADTLNSIEVRDIHYYFPTVSDHQYVGHLLQHCAGGHVRLPQHQLTCQGSRGSQECWPAS